MFDPTGLGRASVPITAEPVVEPDVPAVDPNAALAATTVKALGKIVAALAEQANAAN